ncbi:MAG: hypothetical protein ABR577_18020 [Pyrinomonadaceae bacterium]
MSSRLQKINRATALLVACAVSQVYVFGNAPKINATTLDADETTMSQPETVFGLLIARGTTPILVNGEASPSGTTIRSGSQLQTGDQAEAMVQIGALGTLDIAPNTNLTLEFDKKSVNVKVASGNASLKTSEGIKGFVETPDNVTNQNNSAQNSSANDQDRDHGDDTGEGVLGNLTNRQARTFGVIVFAALVATAIIVVATRGRGRNPSPGTPRGPA